MENLVGSRSVAARRYAWRDSLIVIAFAALPAVLAGSAALSSLSVPSDEAIAAGFPPHEADFQRLLVMLHSDCRRPSCVRESVSLDDLVAVGAEPAAYRMLLTTIGASDLWYVPKSGRVVLPIAAPDAGFVAVTKSYLYTLAPVSSNLHIGGRWFVHREGPAAVMPAPY